jgi:hypothetical protein
MGRPSNLPDDKWAELLGRLARGEKAADLAREYGVSKTAVSVRVSKRAETVKAVANQMLASEKALQAMPIPDRIETMHLVNELREMSRSAAAAGRIGLQNAHRLMQLAQHQIDGIDDVNPLETPHQMKAAMMLGELAKGHSYIGLSLLAANKEIQKGAEGDQQTVVVVGGLPD